MKNSTIEVKDIYNFNFKILKQNNRTWKDLTRSWIGKIKIIIQLVILPKEINSFSAIPIKTLNYIAPKTR